MIDLTIFMFLVELLVALIVVDLLTTDRAIERSEARRNKLIRKLHNAMEASK